MKKPLLYSHTMARAAVLLLTCLSLFGGEEQERNKTIARRFYEEAWFKGNSQAAGEIFAPRYKVFDPRGRMGVEEAADSQVRIARQWCVDNGDCSRSEIVWQMADGDRVATYWILRQAPKKNFLGLLARVFGKVPIERPMINVFRFENGRIVETTNQRDDLGIYSDMGLFNAGAVVVFAMGGALAFLLIGIVNKIVRRSRS
jgi:hypothetical protein